MEISRAASEGESGKRECGERLRAATPPWDRKRACHARPWQFGAGGIRTAKRLFGILDGQFPDRSPLRNHVVSLDHERSLADGTVLSGELDGAFLDGGAGGLPAQGQSIPVSSAGRGRMAGESDLKGREPVPSAATNRPVSPLKCRTAPSGIVSTSEFFITAHIQIPIHVEGIGHLRQRKTSGDVSGNRDFLYRVCCFRRRRSASGHGRSPPAVLLERVPLEFCKAALGMRFTIPARALLRRMQLVIAMFPSGPHVRPVRGTADDGEIIFSS